MRSSELAAANIDFDGPGHRATCHGTSPTASALAYIRFAVEIEHLVDSRHARAEKPQPPKHDCGTSSVVEVTDTGIPLADRTAPSHTPSG